MRNRRLAVSLGLALGLCALGAFLLMVALGDREDEPPPSEIVARGNPETVSTSTSKPVPDSASKPDSDAEPDADPESPADANPEEAPKGPISIQGRVVDLTGEGIPDATVRAVNVAKWTAVALASKNELTGSQDPRKAIRAITAKYRPSIEAIPKAVTDAEGRYAIHALAPADYRLFVSHAEHLPSSDRWVVVEKDAASTADVELVKGYAIDGTVTDVDGKPLAGVAVRARPSTAPSKGIAKLIRHVGRLLDGGILLQEDPGITDSDGRFRISGLEPVTHDIEARKLGFVKRTLPAVRPESADVTVVLERSAAVTARIVDVERKPIASATWTCRPADDSQLDQRAILTMEFDLEDADHLEGKADDEGHVRIPGAKVGRNELVIHADGYPETAFEIVVAKDDEALGDIVLEAGVSIRGRVVAADGVALEGAEAAAYRAGALRQRRGPGGDPDPLARALTDEGGRFELVNLPPGVYDVTASGADYVTATRRDIEGGADDLELSLDRGKLVNLQVIDGETREPIPAVLVRFSNDRSKQGRTDEDGRLVVAGFPPSAGQWTYASVVDEEYASDFKRLTLVDDAVAEPEVIELSRLKSVQGFVVDADGNPVEHARVRVEIPGVPDFMLLLNPGSASVATFSDADGAFTLGLPGQGFGNAPVQIVASHPAFADGRTSRPKGDEAVEIVLTAGVTISGRVTNTRGETVAGARLVLSRRSDVKADGEAAFISALGVVEEKPNYSRRDGAFEFRGVEPGDYELDATAMRHARQTIPLQVSDTDVTRDIVLDSGRSLRGRVVDIDGVPLGGVEVSAFRGGGTAGATEREEIERTMLRLLAGAGVAKAKTDADGRFELTNLADEPFTIVARAGNFEPAEAGPFEPGDRVDEIVLKRHATMRLRVVDASTNLPVTTYQANVRVKPDDAAQGFRFDPFSQFSESVDDVDGELRREGLREGRYDVSIEAKGYAHKSSEVVLAQGRETDVRIALEPGLVARVVVVLESTGEGIPGVTVNHFHFEKQPDGNMRTQHGGSATTDDSGLAIIDSLAAGKHQLGVHHQDYFAVDPTNIEVVMPDDSGREFRFAMAPAGRLKGSFENIRDENFRSVNYLIILQPIPEKPAVARAPGERAKPAAKRQSYHIWVNPTNGQFDQGSLHPGIYTMKFQVRRFEVGEDGKRRSLGTSDVELGTVEISAGKTETLALRAPGR